MAMLALSGVQDATKSSVIFLRGPVDILVIIYRIGHGHRGRVSRARYG